VEGIRGDRPETIPQVSYWNINNEDLWTWQIFQVSLS